MRKLLFITTTNLSTNPRLLKEIKLASDIGCHVSLVAFKLGSWADKTDVEHLKLLNNPNICYISAIRAPFLRWFFSTLVWKICNTLYLSNKNNIKLNAYSHNKRTWQICRFLRRDINKYDLIIAHNLGSLYPAYKLSIKQNTPFAFDIEDYHPGEKCSLSETRRREFLMNIILPKAAYISNASPLIAEYSLKLLKSTSKHGTAKAPSPYDARLGERFIIINNVFSQTEFQFKEVEGDKIKLVWFSQNINAGRGLELLVPALASFKNEIELTLIGNLNQSFYSDFLSEFVDFIRIEKPLNQKVLNLKLSEYDIGLAIELDTADFNRQICLTNKIFAYAQSGLYILATNTAAQKIFVDEHSQIGVLSGQTVSEIQEQITDIVQNIENIRSKKKNRFEYAKKLAWENESKKLLKLWSEVLNLL